MKIKFMVILLMGLILTPLVHAQELTQLSEHVYAFVGITEASGAKNSFGANCGVVIGDDSVMIIDTLISAKKANHLLQQIKQITDKPIKYVVNTHNHLDHTGGNSVFTDLGAVVIGQISTPRNPKEISQTIEHPEVYGLTVEDMEGTRASLPTLLFEDSLLVDLGRIHVKLHYPGVSHTNNSITAYVKEDNVLFVGDIIFNRYHPFLAEGDIGSWVDVLSELDSSPAKIIIPGHGPKVTKDDILDFAVYLNEFDAFGKELCSGKTQEDAPAIAEEMLKRLPDQGRTELPNMVEMNLRMKYLPQP